MNKEKILKHLRKAEEEINNELNIAVESHTVITNIDLEYIYHQISDIITEIENAEDIEEDIEEEDPWEGLEDDDALFDDY
jgi:CRISPR/Cas system CSM-associated protein Csm2 small subunit